MCLFVSFIKPYNNYWHETGTCFLTCFEYSHSFFQMASVKLCKWTRRYHVSLLPGQKQSIMSDDLSVHVPTYHYTQFVLFSPERSVNSGFDVTNTLIHSSTPNLLFKF